MQGATEPGSRNGAIIASITSLAEALEMDTTAEGVETLDELELVRLLGCSHVQGYIYSEPLTATDAAALVAGDLTATAGGPQSARAPRQNLFRRVTVLYENQRYNATLRNVSEGGAMVEGPSTLLPGSAVRIEFAAGQIVTAQVRWLRENRAGVEFHVPLRCRSDGTFVVLKAPVSEPSAMSR